MLTIAHCRFLRPAIFLVACLLALPQPGLGQVINTSSIYRNETIGVRGAFGDWNIITTREQAPPTLRPNFPANKGPNDSPLFIGLHASEQVFLRLLTETYFDDLDAYARLLGQSISNQGLEITSVRMDRDNSALQLDYMHPQLGLRFRERVALLPDSQVIRMAAWTSTAAWSLYAGAIEQAFRDVELQDVINGEPGWHAVWADLEQRLQANDLSGVPMAQPPQAVRQSAAAPNCPNPSSSMLWHVQSPALAASGHEIYLFGSIHVGKPEFYPLPDEIEGIYRDADYVVFEVDPQSAADPAVVMSMQSRGMLPAGQTLADVISADVVADFRRVMGNIGMPAESFMGMQPWFLTLMLTGLQMNALGYLPQYGLESYFLSQRPAAAQILELESIQQQIGFLENLNAETFLAYTLKSFESGDSDIEALIEAWECADKEPLTQMLFADFADPAMTVRERADMEALMDSLYTRRNIDMAGTIAGYADAPRGRYFVVVGSAHLLGEGSVVALLRERGFQVTPVTLDR